MRRTPSKDADPPHRGRLGRIIAALGTVVSIVAWTTVPAVAQPTTTTAPPVADVTAGATPTTTLHELATATPITTTAIDAGPTLDIAVTGHGWGHGRGLGQYGAVGYAVDYGWTSAQILGHYYGNTVAGTSAISEMDVRLISRDGLPLTVYLPSGSIVTSPAEAETWTPAARQAVQVTLQANGSYLVADGDTCAGPFDPRPATVASEWLRIAPADVSLDPVTNDPIIVIRPASELIDNNMLQLCTGDTTAKLYRGELRAARFEDEQRSVNFLPVEQYLRSVVPRESPASWGDLAGGAGMAALEAQAVAARSYSLAEDRYNYAKTCDTTSCQVYSGRATRGGTSLDIHEDHRTDTAIVNTANQVRLRDGIVQRTEFSSSTGGHTAGGTFPAVVDLGDVVQYNPNHDWSTTITNTAVETRYGQTGLTKIEVTARNGLGADGGRVQSIVMHFGDTVVTRSGNQFRLDWNLKSDWFSVSYEGIPPEPVYPWTETGPVTLVVGFTEEENFELLRAAKQLELTPELLQITGVWVGAFLLAIAPDGYVQEPIRPRPPLDGEHKWAVTWSEEEREALDVMYPAWDLTPEEAQKGGSILLIFLAALARAGL